MIGPKECDGTIQSDDLVCLSASTVQSAMAAKGLESWRMWETARRTVDNLPLVTEIAKSSPDIARKWIVDSAFSGREGMLSAADAGTLMHAVAEAWLEGTDVPEVPQYLWPHLKLMASWFEVYRPKRVATELAVFHVAHHVGGRCDGILYLDLPPELLPAGPGNYLVDFKTHQGTGYTKNGSPKKTYVDSHGIQLSIYANASHYMTWEPRVHPASGTKGRAYLVSPDEAAAASPMPDIVAGAVVDIFNDRVSFTTIDVGPDVYQRALACRDVWWWLNKEAKPLPADWNAQ